MALGGVRLPSRGPAGPRATPSRLRLLVLATALMVAACGVPTYPVPGLTTSGFRAPFEAMGATCLETQASQDAAWGVVCRLGQLSSYANGASDRIEEGGALVGADFRAGGGTDAAALEWLKAAGTINYQGSAAATLRAWVDDHYRDPACVSNPGTTGCHLRVGEATWTLDWDHGGRPIGPWPVTLRFIRKDSPYAPGV